MLLPFTRMPGDGAQVMLLGQCLAFRGPQIDAREGNALFLKVLDDPSAAPAIPRG